MTRIGELNFIFFLGLFSVLFRPRNQKKYYSHSGYPGGIKEIVASKLFQEKPEEIIKHAVWGMIPHNRLGRKMMKKLKIYTGSEHHMCRS